MPRTKPTVFIVDDDQAIRESLRWLIESVGLAVEAFASADDYLKQYDPSRPGCLLLDVRMPGTSGLDAHRRLARRDGRLPVIIITGHGDVPMAVRSFKDGAFDFIEKPFNDHALLERIQQAIEHDAHRRRDHDERCALIARKRALTPREAQVMQRVVDGRTNRQIAQGLGVTEKTIETHRAAVMRKMQARSVADLVRIAVACDERRGGK